MGSEKIDRRIINRLLLVLKCEKNYYCIFDPLITPLIGMCEKFASLFSTNNDNVMEDNFCQNVKNSLIYF